MRIYIYMAYRPYFRFKKTTLEIIVKQPPKKQKQTSRKESTSDVEELDGVTWIWLTHQRGRKGSLYCWWFRNPKEPPFGCIKPYEKTGVFSIPTGDRPISSINSRRISSRWCAGNLFEWVVQLFKCSCWVPFRGKKHIQRTYLRTKTMRAVCHLLFF